MPEFPNQSMYADGTGCAQETECEPAQSGPRRQYRQETHSDRTCPAFAPQLHTAGIDDLRKRHVRRAHVFARSAGQAAIQVGLKTLGSFQLSPRKALHQRDTAAGGFSFLAA